MTRKLVIAGGSGFLGRVLADAWSRDEGEAVLLSRRPAPPSGSIWTVVWDGRTANGWSAELEGAAAIVNLAGRSVACLHTPENREEILRSRVDSVRAVASGLASCRNPPPVWIQASSLAIYGNPGDRICDETAPLADDFSARVCKAWEEALFASDSARRVALRIGIVLGRGGALGAWAKLARWFLGGSAGSGRQYVSWLHQDDFVSMVRWAIDRPQAMGTYNATGPNPATNADLMREVRRALGRPWSPPAPEWAVRWGARYLMRADPDLALTGRRCVPRRLLEEGFVFRHPDLRAALADFLP
jgi:uncharacterized protein (TIGR01777 family)